MKHLKSILNSFFSCISPQLFIIPTALSLSGMAATAQGYYDDDLYYDASKAKKETPKAASSIGSETNSLSYTYRYSSTPTKYYYDGAAYVPWDSVGDFGAADSYAPAGGGLTRDIDEYNRRGSAYESLSTPDSISLQDFNRMSATEYLARFGNSQVARTALYPTDDNTGSEYVAVEFPENSPQYNAEYDAGYYTGYNAGYNDSPFTSVNINFGMGYPYSYYNSYGWPYYSWNTPYYYYPSWSWSYGWNYPSWYWGWNWGWGCTYPSWSWGWGYPGHYHGYYADRYSHYHSSPTAAHRPRSTGYNHGVTTDRGGRRNNFSQTTTSSRPGYRPPITDNNRPTGNRGYYGGSTSGRNSHFSGSGSSGYRPTGGGTTINSNHNGYTRPSRTHNSSNFGASQSTRNSSSSNSGYSRSNNYNSSRSSGSYSGSSRSSGHSGGGRSGGGGHRSR